MYTPKATINLVIFLNFVILQASAGSQDVTSSVYGGKPAGILHIHNGKELFLNDGQYPYIVEITVHGQHVCGGALVKKDTVLTAAHCFKTFRICDFRIWAGSYKKLDKKSDNVQIRDVYDVVTHDMFDWELIGPQANDIAVAFVMKSFDLTPFVQIVTMGTHMQRDKFIGTTVVLMGYGKTEDNELSTKLLLGEVTLLEKHECVESLKKTHFVNVLCVKCKNEACTIASGDSGSPLVKIDKHGKHVLIGIASYAFLHWKSEVPAAYKPAVYMDVAEYKEWFKSAKKSKMTKINRFSSWCKNREI